MKTARIVLAACWSLLGPQAALTDELVLEQFGEAYHTAAFAVDVVVDGKLGEAAWAHAERLSLFDAQGWPTDIRFLHDQTNLFVAIEATTRNTAAVVTNYRNPGDPVWRDDALELFFDGNHDHRTFWQVCINAAGVACRADMGPTKVDAVEGYRGAASMEGNRWIVEAVIPLGAIETAHATGRSIPLAVARHVAETVSPIHLTWGEPRKPHLSPHLVLVNGDNAAAFVARYAGLLNDLKQEVMSAGEAASQFQLPETALERLRTAQGTMEQLVAEAAGLCKPDKIFADLSATAAFDVKLAHLGHDAADLKWTLLFAPIFDQPDGALVPAMPRPAQQSDATGNLLLNAGFEQDGGWGFVKGKTDDTRAGVVDGGHGGSKAAEIVRAVPAGGAPLLTQEIKDVTPGAVYELRYWVKTENLSHPDTGIMAGGVGWWIDTPTGAKHHHEAFRDTAGQWQAVVVRQKVPPLAQSMRILAISHGTTGRILLDDVELRRLGEGEGAWPASRLDGEWVSAVNTNIVTPHVPWARNWAGGRLQTVFIVQRSGAREAMELAQRLDMDFDAVVSYHPTAFGLPDEKAIYVGSSVTEKTQQLRHILKRQLDLFVIGNCEWTVIPDEFRYELLRRVHTEGMGLVVVFQMDEPLSYEWRRLMERQTDERRALAEGLPLPLLRFGYSQEPPNAGNLALAEGERDPVELIKTMALGRGRVAYVRYPYPERMKCRGIDNFYTPYGGTALTPYLTYDGAQMRQYEYAMVLLARVCLWAAQREGDVLPPPTRLSAVSAGRSETLIVPMRRLGPGQAPAILEWSVRTADFGVEAAGGGESFALAPGKADVKLALPALPAGRYVAEYRLLADGKVIGFGAPVFDVNGAAAFTNLTLIRGNLTGKEFAVQARVTGTDAAGVRIRVTDRHGRVVLERNQTPDELAAGLPLPIVHSVTSLHRLDLTAVDAEGHPLAAIRREFVVSDAPVPDYLFIPWGCDEGYYTDRLMHGRASRDFAVNARYGTKHQDWANASASAQNGQALVLSGPSFYAARPWKPSWRVGKLHQVKLTAARLREHGIRPLGVMFGDESSFFYGYSEIPQEAEATEAIRQWLKKHVGELDAVNRRWGTGFKTWEAVVPIRLDETLASGQTVRWYDGWRALCSELTGLLAAAEMLAREPFPGIGTGFEGALPSSAGIGYEIPALYEHLGFFGSYPRLCRWLEMRSFRQPHSKMLAMTHARDADPEGRQGEWFVWSSVFQQFEGLMFHRLDASVYGSMGYDLSVRRRWLPEDEPVRTAAEAAKVTRHPLELDSYADYVREVNRGPAKLVRGAARVGEQTAILVSQPSIYAHFLFESVKGDRPKRHQVYEDNTLPWAVTWLHLDDLRVGTRMLSVEQVAAESWWVEQGIKLLVLPMTYALSAEAAEGIRAFVKAGGVVVAGLRPAIMDGDLRIGNGGLLDDVFGATRATTTITPLATASAKVAGIGEFPVIEYDPDTKLTSGKARGNVGPNAAPMLIENSFGKGKAFLWNLRPRYNGQGHALYEMCDQWGRRLLPSEQALAMGYEAQRTALKLAVDAAGVTPICEFTGDGDALRAVEVNEFQRGPTRLLGLARHAFRLQPEIDRVTVRWPGAQHVYNVRTGQYLGEGETFGIPLRWGGAALLASLPYKVDGLEVAAEHTGNVILATVRIRGSVGDNPYHVMEIRATEPAGVERPELTQTIMLDGEETVCKIPLAVNNPSGTWTITARDVISSLSASATVPPTNE